MIKLMDILLSEKAKRDYKDEYKKFQSSKKSKKYRAELNKYNRQKGTYGNGDKKDASHKGGKIVGFEEQSKNRGRAEKSRLKKEGKLTENGTIKFSKEEMAKLHKDGKLEKDGHTYIFSEGKLTEGKFYAFWNRKKYTINGKSLYDAKQKAITQLKVPKSKVGLLAVVNAGEHDKGSFKFEGKLKEAKESIFDVAARVLKNKQYEKYKGVRIDLQTANLLSTVHSKVNNKMRGILTKLGDQNIKQLINTLWAIAK